MGKWSDAILEESSGAVQTGQPAQTAPTAGRWSGQLLEGPSPTMDVPQVQPYRAPDYGATTLSADPSPRQPGMKPYEYEPAGFGTMIESEIVDDPETRMGIFAKARGLPASRYFMERGKIKFIGEDGYAHDEVDDETTWQKLKRLGATAVANAPAEILAGVGGFVAGPVGAGAGAAGGGAIRKGIAATLYDEPQTLMGNLWDVGVAGTVGVASETAGRLAVGALNKGLQRGPVAKLVSGDHFRINPATVDALEKKAKEQGIDLLAPESADLPWAQTTYKVLRQRPGKAGDIVRDFELNTRIPQVDAAIERNLGAISPEDSIGLAAEKGVQAANAVKEGLKAKRKAIADPLYEKAFSEAAPVNLQPVYQRYNAILENAGGDARKTLEALRKDFFGPKAEPWVKGGGTFRKDLRSVHGLKEAIDDKIDALVGQEGTGSTIAKLMEVKTALLGTMDAASPGYATARKAFEQASTPLNEFGESVLRRVLNLKGEQIDRAPQILFGPKSSPRAIQRARNYFEQAGQMDQWNGLLRAHMEDVLQRIPESVPDMGKGARFRNDLVKGKGMANLKSAMNPDQFKTFNNFLDVLEATGRIVDRNSDTVAKQMARDAVEGESIGALRRLGRKSPQQMALDGAAWFLDSLRQNGSAEKLAAALVDPANVKTVRQLKQLPMGSQKWIRAASALLGEGTLAQVSGPRGSSDPYGARAGAESTRTPAQTPRLGGR